MDRNWRSQRQRNHDQRWDYNQDRPNNQGHSYNRRPQEDGWGQDWHRNRSRNTEQSSFDENWECHSCHFSNYPSRTSCYKCKCSKRNESSPSYSSDYEEIPREEGLIDWDFVYQQHDIAQAERIAALPPLTKNVYVEDPEVEAMMQEDVDQFREENFGMSVHVSDDSNEESIPNPVRTFRQAFKHYPEILEEIEGQGFERPSPIQCQSWPILMQGRDMIGIAQTGTGKTLAFILPALLHIAAQPTPRKQRVGPTCLVLAPTRELAQQIEKEVSKYNYKDIQCVCVYGQGDKRSQVRKIKAKAEIVVATPGRLNDFTGTGILDLSAVSYLVLDEADRMLDMGFEPQIRKAVLITRPDRQTVMTSATWPEGIRDLARKLMKDPITVVVGSLDLKAVHTVAQSVVMCDENEKQEKLVEFIRNLKGEDKAIVFVGRKCVVDLLSVEMIERGLCVQVMHGDICQADREQALSDLKSGRVRVLLATDVASRGIDVNDVTHILNYDCPRDMEEYVHRVGRTGRAGRSGQAFTFITRNDWSKAGKLVQILKKSNQAVPLGLVRMMERWQEAQDKKYENRSSFRY